VDDYINIGNGINFEYTDAFTYSFWVNPDAVSGVKYLFSKYDSGRGVLMYFNSSGGATPAAILFNLYNTNSGSTATRKRITTTTGNILTKGVWSNIVITYDGSGLGSGIKLYKNGVSQTVTVTQDNLQNSTIANTEDAYLSSYNGASSFFVGNQDEFAIYNTELSAADALAIYGAGQPTDLTSLSPIAWYRMGDNGSWKSPQWLIPSNENKDKVSNYSFQLDGIDDYIDCGDSNDFSFGDGLTDTPFSVSAWINIKSFGTNNVVFSKDSGLPNREYAIGFFSGFKNLRFYIKDNGGNNQQSIDSTTLFAINTWYNITCTYDGSGGSNAADGMNIYVNSVLETPTNVIKGTYTAMSNTTAPVNIGRYGAAASPLNAKVDEVSLYDSELSQIDVTDIYNGGTPTTISGAVAHYKMGEEANFTSNWLVDNSALDNYSKRSFAFDGVGDYVELGRISHLQNTTEYSISSWFKSPLNNVNQVVYGWFDGADGYLQLLLKSNGSLIVYNYRTSTAYGLSATGIVSADTWYNALVVFDGGGVTNSDRLKLYVNGSLISLTYTGTIPTQTGTMLINTMQIGSQAGALLLEGNIDEVSIFDSAISIGDVWDGSGQPIDVSAVSGLANYYRMGEDASFNGTDWTVLDQVGSNDGTSNAMMVDSLVGEAPNYSGGGISNAMNIFDRVGEAPNSSNNSVSFNMDEVDRVTDVP